MKKIWTSPGGTAAVPWSGHGRPRPPPSPGGRIQYSQEGGEAKLEKKNLVSPDGTAEVPWSGHGRPRPPPRLAGGFSIARVGGRARRAGGISVWPMTYKPWESAGTRPQ